MSWPKLFLQTLLWMLTKLRFTINKEEQAPEKRIKLHAVYFFAGFDVSDSSTTFNTLSIEKW
jgi:hypothetical protein